MSDILTKRDGFCLTFDQTLGKVYFVSKNSQIAEVESPVGFSSVNPMQVLKEVLELQRESDPGLDIDALLVFAEANPTEEVVDSLGAVSVVCALFGAYTPETLIPHHLLTHANFSTFHGLQQVIHELERTHLRQ
jgi:hydrogenase maturation factor HypE